MNPISDHNSKCPSRWEMVPAQTVSADSDSHGTYGNAKTGSAVPVPILTVIIPCPAPEVQELIPHCPRIRLPRLCSQRIPHVVPRAELREHPYAAAQRTGIAKGTIAIDERGAGEGGG